MPEPDQQQINPALGVVIDALSNGGQVDALGLLRSQMQSQLPDDPQTALLMRLLERRQQLESERQAEAAGCEDDTASEQDSDAAEKQEAFRELKEKVDTLYAEIEALRKRNDTLALALGGACYLCFGENPLCEECHGRGAPGSRAPEPDKFRRYILPACRRAKYTESVRSGPPRLNEVGPGQSAAYHPSSL